MTDAIFVGTSSRNITEALQNAIGAAKENLHAASIHWEVDSIFGEVDRGLIETNTISVRIRASAFKHL